MLRATSMSMSSLAHWSPRQFSASGKGQTPLAVGSCDYYFGSDQSEKETNWKLRITSETNTLSNVKLQVYYLPSSPVRIENVSCTYLYSTSVSFRLLPPSPRQRQVTEFDIHIQPDHGSREWFLVLEVPGCHLSNMDRDVTFSAVYRKLATDDVEGVLAVSSETPVLPKEEAGPKPAEKLADDFLKLLTSEQNADVEFHIVKGGGGGGGGRVDGDEEVESFNKLPVNEGQWASSSGQVTPVESQAVSPNQQMTHGLMLENSLKLERQQESPQHQSLWCQANIPFGDTRMRENQRFSDGSQKKNNNNNNNDDDGVIIKAHKAILTARVPYFERLFDSGMQETETNRIVVKDATAENFRQFLRFIYAGRMPDNIEEKTKEFLALSEKYDLGFLKRVCEQTLTKKLDKNNLVEMLVWADLYRCETLKTECLRKYEECRSTISADDLKPLKKYPDLMFEMLSFGGK